MSGIGSINDGEPEFQIAPMIDVLLTILVFFMMITCAEVLRVDKQINLPVSKHALKRENNRTETIINIRWSEATQKPTFVIDNKIFADTEDFVTILTVRRQVASARYRDQSESHFTVDIRGDRDCPSRYISQVVSACTAAGISDISFSAENKE